MIQLRNVTDAVHPRLKARAAIAGTSLSDYLLAEIKGIGERPTLAESRERLHKRKPISAQIDTAHPGARRAQDAMIILNAFVTAASSDIRVIEHRAANLFA